VSRPGAALVAVALALGGTARADDPLVDPALQLIVTPAPAGQDAHAPFITAIDAAATSIDMMMFHLTDPEVVDALVRAAARGVHVRVIVDGKGLRAKGNKRAFDQLVAGKVLARTSSPAFSITHAKAMVVDSSVAFITAINLTRDADRTRDLGVITRAPAVVAEVAAIFAADWDNAMTRGNLTPPLTDDAIVVSPVSSRKRLLELIGAAQRELLVTVENLGDPKIEAALAAAVRHGVTVRVLLPLCDKNEDPLYNLPGATELVRAGADVRMMPPPESATQPYMHSKMILADGATAYVGSVNFSVNSTTRARELGIVFAQPAAAAQIRAIFEIDWTHGVAPPAHRGHQCRAA
jgi:cardiolipin synthase A/B